MRVNANALSSCLHADLSAYIDTTLPGWASDSTPQEAACYVLRDTLLKKFQQEDKPSKAACVAALEKFRAVNKHCGDWSIPYEFSQDELIVGEIKSALYDFWFSNEDNGPLVSDVRECFVHGRAGPGASIGARDSDFYTKMFDSNLSCTRDFSYMWERCVSQMPLWLDAEVHRACRYGTTVVDSSNYSFVNKTTTIARGICTEPSINMWMQLGFGSRIERALKAHFNIDFSGRKIEDPSGSPDDSQPNVNRVLARVGSRDDSLVTIDLESASDSMACSILKELLPKSFYDWLDLLRCPVTKLPSGERVALNMVSTMGNGFNFPVMTALFSAVVKACYRLKGIPFKTRGPLESRNVGVFGDDIIVDKRCAALVLRGLYLLGFKVNESKTFVEGRFRESCGADYIDGINVRGVYIKSLASEQDLFVAINTLTRWTAKTGVSLPETVSLLLTGIKSPCRKAVPPDESDDAGIHLPVEVARRNNKTTNIGQTFYFASVPRKWDFIIAGEYVWTYKEQVRRNYNPSGLMISFLAGSIRGYRVALRQRVVRYTTKRKMTPRWGYFPPRPLEGLFGPSSSRLFVDACDRNFVNSVFWSAS